MNSSEVSSHTIRPDSLVIPPTSLLSIKGYATCVVGEFKDGKRDYVA